jgi:Flp pilus assembly protein TadD
MPGRTLDLLAPAVRTFASRRTGFALEADVRNLLRVRAAEAHEAALFYGGRIVEALTTAAVRRIHGPLSDTFGNLILLQEIDLLHSPAVDFGHALRRLGNEARHLRRPVGAGDAASVLGLVAAWMKWFFVDFRAGARLPALTVDGSPLVLPGGERVAEVVAAIEAKPGTGAAPVALQAWADAVAAASGFDASPVFATHVAQELIDHGDHPSALRLLQSCKRVFPHDLRATQLEGLAASRAGELDRAIDLLRRLSAIREDEETLGIMGGALKRRWDRGASRGDLADARRAYRRGFELSRSRNVYLGVNVATTALLDGDVSRAQATARDVRNLLEVRRKLAAHGAFGYWNQVTLAEALLLSGELEEAWRSYHAAFAALPPTDRRPETTLRQAALVLERLGLPLDATCFRDAAPAPVADALRVGVTGHRRLADPDGLRAAVAGALRGRRADRGVVLLTALAEGADRIAAHAVLAEGGRLHAVLPLPPAEFAQDFASAASVEEFRALLARCARVTVVAAPESAAGDPRTAAYEASGRAVVDGCDVLVALWDGAGSRGRGGTAEIVAHARERGREVLVIPAVRSS